MIHIDLLGYTGAGLEDNLGCKDLVDRSPRIAACFDEFFGHFEQPLQPVLGLIYPMNRFEDDRLIKES